FRCSGYWVVTAADRSFARPNRWSVCRTRLRAKCRVVTAMPPITCGRYSRSASVRRGAAIDHVSGAPAELSRSVGAPGRARGQRRQLLEPELEDVDKAAG